MSNEQWEELRKLEEEINGLEERLTKPMTPDEYADLVDRTFHYYEEEYRR